MCHDQQEKAQQVRQERAEEHAQKRAAAAGQKRPQALQEERAQREKIARYRPFMGAASPFRRFI
jgi:hypothetical protein